MAYGCLLPIHLTADVGFNQAIEVIDILSQYMVSMQRSYDIDFRYVAYGCLVLPIHLTVDAPLLVAASGKAVGSLLSQEQEQDALCYIQVSK